MKQKKTIVFVCVENACRSQMAEAFAKMFDSDVTAYSGGSRPSGKINEKAIAAMDAVGYDLKPHASQGLDEIPDIEYDCVVTMGCGDACPTLRAKRRVDWDIPDPKNIDQSEFNRIRDIIQHKVLHLIREIQSAR